MKIEVKKCCRHLKILWALNSVRTLADLDAGWGKNRRRDVLFDSRVLPRQLIPSPVSRKVSQQDRHSIPWYYDIFWMLIKYNCCDPWWGNTRARATSSVRLDQQATQDIPLQCYPKGRNLEKPTFWIRTNRFFSNENKIQTILSSSSRFIKVNNKHFKKSHKKLSSFEKVHFAMSIILRNSLERRNRLRLRKKLDRFSRWKKKNPQILTFVVFQFTNSNAYENFSTSGESRLALRGQQGSGWPQA